mgnify:FL=1
MTNPNPNPLLNFIRNLNPRVRVGARVRCVLKDGSIDPVVYTVQEVVSHKGKRLPVIHDNWTPVVLQQWVAA